MRAQVCARKYAHTHNGSYSGVPVVVQQLVPTPLLIGGHKMDLRLYCLVTSYRPLKAWMYRQGFARFCTVRDPRPNSDPSRTNH